MFLILVNRSTSTMEDVIRNAISRSVPLAVPVLLTYFLIVPQGAEREGSYGTTSEGDERVAAADACLPQQIGVCE